MPGCRREGAQYAQHRDGQSTCEAIRCLILDLCVCWEGQEGGKGGGGRGRKNHSSDSDHKP